MEAGVYLISNNVNGKCYVGSTIHLDQRRREHFSKLANNKHINAHLQNAYNKYGREAFDFEVLETIDIDDNIKDKLLKREQFWISNQNTISYLSQEVTWVITILRKLRRR